MQHGMDVVGLVVQMSSLYTRSAHTLPITALAVGAGDADALVCSTARDAHVKLWSMAQGTQLASFALPGAALCLLLTPCEQRVYAGGTDGDLYEVCVEGRLQKKPLSEKPHQQTKIVGMIVCT